MLPRLLSRYRAKLYSNLKVRLCSSANVLNPSDPSVKKYLDKLYIEYKELVENGLTDYAKQHRAQRLRPTVAILEEKNEIEENLVNLNELLNSKDDELAKLAREERESYQSRLSELNSGVFESLLTDVSDYADSSVIVEIVAGTGGQEAMLFASELFQMYVGLAGHYSWRIVYTEEGKSDLGGTRHAMLIVRGVGVKPTMLLESGVHRVQRVPTTEKGGRLHTSTAIVAVLPEPTEFELDINERDLRIETKRASGAGGQHVNKTESCVRITHLPSGLAAEAQEDRSQVKNREIAMQKLRARLLKKMQDEQDSSIRDERKAQMGTGERNEKIRTYNYPQDRITDHRLPGGTLRNLAVVMAGGSTLATLQQKLKHHKRLQLILDEIKNL